MRHVVRKVAAMEGKLVWFRGGFTTGTLFQTGELAYNSLPESMCSVYPVFHVSILKSATSNTFSKRIQLAPSLVIIDREPEYEISQIVNSKINHQQA